MGRLPYMTAVPREGMQQTMEFLGLNLGTVVGDSEFTDMRNMSTEKFPAVSTRRRRGVVLKHLVKPNGIFYKDGLVYADGTQLFYRDRKIANVSDSEKTFVGMGAYLLVWPDKLIYNTSTGTMERMEASWGQTAQATFEPLQEGSTLVRVTCSGIGKNFRQYDGVTMAGCSREQFNRTFVIQELGEDYIVMTGDLAERMTQASGLTLKRTVPDMDFVCENENRVWGCSSKNHEIYASKLGDPGNWNVFEGISTDSYAATIGSDGAFTGCVSYLGYVMFFKEDAVHKVYGSKPANYQVMTSGINGVSAGCEKTVTVVNETLYYVARNGVYAFNGAQPEMISQKLEGLSFSAGTAGVYRNRYYASLRDQTGAWTVYVYDALRGLWSKEDGLALYGCAYGAGELYCIDSEGNLFTVSGDRDEVVEWMLETGDLMDGAMEFKHLRRILMYFRMEAGAELNVEVMYDNDGNWEPVAVYRTEHYRTRAVNLVPRRCVHYRIRLYGIGDVTLMGMARKVGYGTGIRGIYR